MGLAMDGGRIQSTGECLDWAVVGAGPQGVHLAWVLHRRLGVPLEQLVLLDPKPPLAQWRRRAHQVAMEVLRSPIVHHLDLDAMSLHRFRKSSRAPLGAFVEGPYDRPSLDLFNAHCDELLAASGLLQRWRPWCVTGIDRERGALHLRSSLGELRARKVILALGAMPSRGAVASGPCGGDTPISHCLDDGFDRDDFASRVRSRGGRVAIVGGGTSGVGLARCWSRQGLEVTLIARRPTVRSEFDTDPCWHGPKCLDGFQSQSDPVLRRQAVVAARRGGSLPPDQARLLERDRLRRALALEIGEPMDWGPASGDGIRIRLAGGRQLRADGVVFATGLCTRRPGGAWLDSAIDALGLPTAPCGYPILGNDLHWGAGIYAVGALAELELGPVARNLSGARLAGERLARAAVQASRRTLVALPQETCVGS